MKTSLAIPLLVALNVAPRCGAARIEAGNDFYGVAVRQTPNFAAGFVGAWVGRGHPVDGTAGYPGSSVNLLHVVSDCVSCPGGDPIGATFVVRSRRSGSDFTLGGIPALGFFGQEEPGYSCINVNDIASPIVERITEAGQPTGVRSVWHVIHAGDDLLFEEVIKAHGDDWIGASVEATLRVVNLGMEEASIGVRMPLNLITDSPYSGSGPPGASQNLMIFLRPPDATLDPPTVIESEWFDPSFRMWQGYSDGTGGRPGFYSIACAMGGPAVTLDPDPTPPDMLQYANASNTRAYSGGGSYDGCFTWRVPEPPRDLDYFDMTGITSYWGLDDASSITVPPGGEVRFTQYFVAFLDYPLSAETSGPFEAPCDGAVTTLPVDGRAVLIDTTTSPIAYQWSSPDPRVSFADATAASTEAIVAGAGEYPVTLTVAVGAYEAAVTTTVTVRDETPPDVTLRVSPATLWPPNHRMVDVHVAATVTDDCDPAPTIRLVSATSSEDALERGSGRSAPDIAGADAGTADFDVQLRAERSGRRDGRTYRLTYEATDWAGNVTTSDAVVTVPHDRRSPTRTVPRRP